MKCSKKLKNCCNKTVKYLFGIFLTVLFVTSNSRLSLSKEADLAGMWYTDSPDALREEIERYLDKAIVKKIDGDIIGLIAPHAGFIYSGEIAAYSYKAAQLKNPDLVIVIGFSHKMRYSGTAVFMDEAYSTPLGDLKIDTELSKKIASSDSIFTSSQKAFEGENSIEMQIPFIQVALKNPRVVLLAIGEQNKPDCDRLIGALYKSLKDEKSFVFISSTDMCHYLPYDEAVIKDKNTINSIANNDPDAFYETSEKNYHELMCGFGATYVVMSLSKKFGADKVEVLKYANSGDTSGRKDSVVGYVSAAFIKEASAVSSQPSAKKEGDEMFTQEEKKKLLKIARDTIVYYLKTGKKLEVKAEDKIFQEEMGAFVTLHKDGELRGCIGNMIGRGPLYLTVRDMAVAAAVEDPRFPPVELEEMEDIDIEISALSPMEKISDYNKIEVGKHGVMVKRGWQSGVYLPQVATETGWNREEFMNSLCAHKAGIPTDSWKTGKCEIYIFTAEVFGEKEVKN